MKSEFVSLADHLRHEGRQEELERKNRVSTENMLQKGFEISIICDVLDVSPEFVEKVRKALKE